MAGIDDDPPVSGPAPVHDEFAVVEQDYERARPSVNSINSNNNSLSKSLETLRSSHTSLEDPLLLDTTPPATSVIRSAELGSNVRVVVRVRPFSEFELSKTEDRAVVCDEDAQTLHVARGLEPLQLQQLQQQDDGVGGVGGSGGGGSASNGEKSLSDKQGSTAILNPKWRPLTFQRVLGEEVSQYHMFEESGVKDLVLQAING